MQEFTVEKDGFAACFHQGSRKQNAVIIRVGGSGAEKERVIASGQFLVDAGYSVLFLGYYLWSGLGNVVSEIPLDYVEKAIHRLKQCSGNPNLKIGMTGISQGALYTLACASKIPEISTIALASPFDYVMEGTTSSFKRTGKSSYTWHGEALPFSQWELLNAGLPKLFIRCVRDKKYGLSRMLRFAYDNNPVTEQSAIAVENMNADVLLLASANDDCWPSDVAAIRIENRLKTCGYAHIVESRIYEKGCHNMGGDMLVDGKRAKKLQKMMKAWYDHPQECRECISDSKQRILDFFDRTL